MARFFKKREEIKSLSPGSMVFVGNKKVLTIKETSQEILTRRYPKLATIITIFVSAVTFTIYNPQQKYCHH